MTLSAVLLSLLLAVVSDEMLAWSPRLAEWIVRLNARALPPRLRERYIEEWLSDMASYPGKIAKLVFALDTLRAAFGIAHALRLPHVSSWVASAMRMMDLVMAIALLVAGGPLLILAALGIRLADGAPVFFCSVRVGRDGQTFRMFKFRTISLPNRKFGASAAATHRDEVVLSPIGRFIRSTRIDELPSLLNLLRGDLSLVGPRPERPEFVAEVLRVIPGYAERYRVRPGLTGHAQIEYPYGSTPEDLRKKYILDLEYIRRYSFSLNLRILARTVSLALFGVPSGRHQ